MIGTTPAQERLDPTLATLVPARSRVRVLVLALVAAVLLAVAWFSPHLVRPGLTSDGGWGMTYPSSHQVLTGHQAVVRGWPSVTLHEVRSGTEGARVLDAWLVRGHDDVGPDPTVEHPDGLGALRASDLGDDLDELRLPASAPDGTEVQLLVLWEVTDCAALPDADVVHDPADQATQVTASTALGPRRTAGLGGPDLLDRTWIEDTGACP